MSVAYFIVLDNEDVDFDSYVNGKAIADVFDELAEFCKEHELKTIEAFHSQDVSEFVEEFDEIELPEQEESWFSAQEGIDWTNSLIEKIKNEKPLFGTDVVIEDLKEYLEVFSKAKKVGAKWHLELDF